MRFGIYLMRRGVLSPEQLIEALEEQLDQLPQLGQLAMEEGMLTVPQVLQVLRAQAMISRERFGDAAMELGLLDRAGVARLLMLQSERSRPLHEVLVKLGTIDTQTVQEELAAFRRDRERSGTAAPSLDDESLTSADATGATLLPSL